MISVKLDGEFIQDYRILVKDSSELKSIIDEKIMLFKKNPDDTRLDNHPLTKRLSGKWAFSITDDIRIVYEWEGKKAVRFLAIGGHRKVYKRFKKVKP